MTAIPALTMTAVEIKGKGGPDVLVAAELPVPQPGPGQVLIEVAAAGVNRPDVLQRQGVYPPPAGHSPLPGLEVAGTIAAVGEGVQRWQRGDKVCALLNGGGYAQFAVAEDTSTLPIPAGLGMVEAAAVPETFFTVWHNLFERGGLQSGEWVLIHGGSSGIGTTAIQLAAAFGANVIATAGSTTKCDACLALGAKRAVNYKTEDFVAAVKETTGGRGVALTLDMVGGDYLEKNVVAAAEDGRIVVIATLNGPQSTFTLARLMMKRITLTGSTLRPRPRAFKGQIAAALEAKVWPLLAAGTVKVAMDQTFPLAQAADAHRRMEEGSHIGKIVLVV